MKEPSYDLIYAAPWTQENFPKFRSIPLLKSWTFHLPRFWVASWEMKHAVITNWQGARAELPFIGFLDDFIEWAGEFLPFHLIQLHALLVFYRIDQSPWAIRSKLLHFSFKSPKHGLLLNYARAGCCLCMQKNAINPAISQTNFSIYKSRPVVCFVFVAPISTLTTRPFANQWLCRRYYNPTRTTTVLCPRSVGISFYYLDNIRRGCHAGRTFSFGHAVIYFTTQTRPIVYTHTYAHRNNNTNPSSSKLFFPLRWWWNRAVPQSESVVSRCAIRR